jgi:hypothetical protein
MVRGRLRRNRNSSDFMVSKNAVGVSSPVNSLDRHKKRPGRIKLPDLREVVGEINSPPFF